MGRKYAAYDNNGIILGFYNDDIHMPDQIPSKSVRITDEEWQDCLQNPGLRRVNIATKTIVEYTPPEPTAEELQQQQLTALDGEYNPQFDALTLAWATASMEGDNETAEARKADKDALKAEYQSKREAITSGD